jgi:SulP family sulfate permease
MVSVGVLLLVLVTLVFLTPLFAPLPKAALAGVIIVVGVGLLEPAAFRKLAAISRSEAILALLAAGIVVAVGMLAGVVIVAFVSLLLVAQRAARPHTTLLVRVPGTDSYRGLEHTPGGIVEPGILIYRFDAPLFFANADVLRDDLTEAIGAAEPPARWVVLDMEAVSDVDSTATETLLEAVDDMTVRGIGLALARLKAPVAEYLARAGLLDAVGRDRIYLEVDDAVSALRMTIPSVAASTASNGTTGEPSPTAGGGT